MEVFCENCGDRFDAPDASAGGIVNCPRCGKATSVPGLRDPLWRLIQLGTVAVAALAFALVWRSSGAAAAVVAMAFVPAPGGSQRACSEREERAAAESSFAAEVMAAGTIPPGVERGFPMD